jgi:S-methylmethionine-dependent homocysteine/selenocysteine methylase
MSAVIRLTASTQGTNCVEIDQIKAAIKSLTTDDRRKIALYILELEKEHVQKSFCLQSFMT